MKLTESQKLTLMQLNQEFKNIIKQQQQDPSSFDNHVNCLNKLEKVVEQWMSFLSPYINWQLNESEKLLNAKWNIFKQRKIKNEMGEYKKILDEINSIFFDDDLKQLMKIAFEGKPVTGFNVHIDDKGSSRNTYQGTFFEHSHIVTYKITFRDGTELSWHSLKDEKELAKARQIFETKVPQPKKEIAHEPTNTTKEMETRKSIKDEEHSESNMGDDYSFGCRLI